MKLPRNKNTLAERILTEPDVVRMLALDRDRRNQLLLKVLVLGDDELAICRDCFKAAARFGRLGGGNRIQFDLEQLP